MERSLAFCWRVAIAWQCPTARRPRSQPSREHFGPSRLRRSAWHAETSGSRASTGWLALAVAGGRSRAPGSNASLRRARSWRGIAAGQQGVGDAASSAQQMPSGAKGGGLFVAASTARRAASTSEPIAALSAASRPKKHERGLGCTLTPGQAQHSRRSSTTCRWWKRERVRCVSQPA